MEHWVSLLQTLIWLGFTLTIIKIFFTSVEGVLWHHYKTGSFW